MKTTEQLAAFHQGNVEAVMASGKILAGGMQDFSGHLVETAKSAMAETMSAWRAMAGVGSVQEVFALQSNFARASIEKGLADTHRMTATGLRLAEQAAAPLAARARAAVEALTSPL
jgi:phasin family protein